MFTFKLAPLWNLIGKSFYLPGFSFLSLPCSIDTVEWNILFTDDDTKLEIKAMKMTLFPLTYEYVIKNAEFNAMGNLNNITIFYSSWVYVLPKLTKAKVVSVSKTLPSNCPFANYNDLRSILIIYQKLIKGCYSMK
ncbi:PREDICTED: uncharacterized protein C18orf63-like [Ceratosolen solmsi marchali]|uniref:Uncharacterized protein C18orf63-like n=1 Tax=Ceratosolen solmsi marchali TaxID=326594 RepID=A0AAJ6YQH5_9HYME|nr:PREDICTED: uncharacterized protein C18orf63-like [Ceratosolen solmsi marchali]